MKVSAKTEYACIAMLELAASYGSTAPVRIRTIAERHDIPSRFLVQILLQLKGAGLVASTRGAAGGYRLIKPPEEVSLGMVMSVVDGQEEQLTSNAGNPSSLVSTLFAKWQDVASVEREMLSSVSFADLVEQAQQTTENMYYI